MPYTNILVHLIWTTKNREKIISQRLKPLLLNHIQKNAKDKKIYIDSLNCTENHIHLLVALKADQSIGKVVQLLKGESSFWINKNKMTIGKFEWQDEYIAVSVSQSLVDKDRQYIKNQVEHHQKKSFAEEYNEFMKKYGFEIPCE